METIILIGGVTLGTPLVAGAIIALGAALEPPEDGGGRASGPSPT